MTNEKGERRVRRGKLEERKKRGQGKEKEGKR